MPYYYYTQEPASAHKERSITARALGLTLTFETDAGVFSKNELDPGSRLLIESMGALSGRVLDLGCGWGPVGTALGRKYPDAQILLSDVNERAVELAGRNLRSNGVTNAAVVRGDGYEAVEGRFDAIVLNPPIRAGKGVIYALFEGARAHLTDGGALYIVIRKQQGAESAEKYLRTLYGSVERICREKGYWVLRCAEVNHAN